MAKLKINPSTIAIPSDEPHGTYHLADNPLLYEIQRDNNFEFVVTNLDGLLKVGMTGTEEDAYYDNAQEMLRLSVEASSVPHFSQKPIEVHRGNDILKYAGTPSFGEGKIKIIDFIGAEAKAILMSWQNLSYNVDTEKVGLITDYKKDCFLLEYSPDYQLLRKWKLYGCWVSSIDEADFDAGRSDKRSVTATIVYDKAKIDRTDEI